MASLRIPRQLEPGFEKIATLEESVFAKILTAAGDLGASLQDDDLPEQFASLVPEISLRDASSILTALLSLYQIRAELEITSEQLTQDIYKSIAQDDSYSKALRDGIDTLRDRTLRILSISSFERWTKALEIANSYPNVLRDIRVFTDIRPLFSDSVNEPPVGALLIHTLKLEYMKNGELNEIYVSLSSAQIEKLVSAFQRADEKAARLRTVLETAGTTHYDL